MVLTYRVVCVYTYIYIYRERERMDIYIYLKIIRLELLCKICENLKISQLLFADDTGLVADSEEKLFRLVSEFVRVCEKVK